MVRESGMRATSKPETCRTRRLAAGPSRRIEAGVGRPVIYFQVSAWRPVMESLAAAGVQRHHVRLWTAHYNGRPHLCSEACNFG